MSLNDMLYKSDAIRSISITMRATYIDTADKNEDRNRRDLVIFMTLTVVTLSGYTIH